MSHSAVVHTRINAATKAATERILGNLGLTPTEAIRLFYRRIAMRGVFPLELKVPNSTTAAALEKGHHDEELQTFQIR